MPNTIDTSSLDDANNSGKPVQFAVSPVLLVPKTGHKYTLRLIHFLDSNSKRTKPYIVTYNHTFYRKNDYGDIESIFAACPKTPRFQIDDWKEQCPFCMNQNLLYDKGTKEKDSELLTIAKKFRAKYNAFFPVIVIKTTDKTVPVNSVKILCVSSEYTFNDIVGYIKNNKDLTFFNSLTDPNCYNLELDCYMSDKGYRNIKARFAKTEKVLASIWNEEKQNKFYENKLAPLEFDKEYFRDFNGKALNDLFANYGAPMLAKNSTAQSTAKTNVDSKPVNNSVTTTMNQNQTKKSQSVDDDFLTELQNDDNDDKPQKEEPKATKPKAGKPIMTDDEDLSYIDDLLGKTE